MAAWSRTEVAFHASARTSPAWSFTAERELLFALVDRAALEPGSRLPILELQDRFGVGLTNTVDRLRIQYGHRHTFKYSDQPEGGAQIEICIPYAVTGDSSRENELNRELPAQVRSEAPGEISNQESRTPVSAAGRT